MGSTVIGFWGGMALLISSITGPGLTTIPLLFQQAGWLTPTLAFLLFGCISGVVSLFLVETMSTIHGNESFQARVEYSTVAHLYLGDRMHLFMQILLYCALQSVNLSSVIISEQTMDSLLIRLFHKTCALSFTEGWTCVSEINPGGSPFHSYILFSLGYLISAAMVLPLSMMSLVENIKFQLASVAALFLVMALWIFIFAQHGLDLEIPAFGSNQSTLIGFVLNNFAFVTTVPSFINELSRHVPIHRTIAYPIMICVVLYLMVGLMGAASFKIAGSSDILATLSASNQNRVLITIVNILFPIAVLVTSVPVFAIVIRYNLVRGGFCYNKWAIVWANMSWLLIIPFQTKGWLILVMNWSSLIFGSSTNFIVPLLLYLSSKTYSASTVDTTGGDLFVLHREDSSTSSRRRSLHDARRSLESLPRIRPTSDDSEPRSTYHIPTSPIFIVHPPSVPMYDGPTNNTSASKIPDELDAIEERQESSGSNLDPNSIPLRVIYSPSVSRSGSVGQSDRPSIVLSSDDNPDGEIPILPSEDDSALVRSFEAPTVPDGYIYRRSRASSHASNIEPRHSSSNPNSPSVRRPSSPTGRLAFEESGTRDHIHAPPVFVALPHTKWVRPMVAAKTILAFVCCAVLGNLIYTIVETAKGNSPLSA